MSVFHLPDLGEGLKEAEIVTWHVGEGDHVVADQPLVSVETDKAVVEIPAPHAGLIAKLHGAVGDIVQTGAPLVAFADAPEADTGAMVGEIEPRTPKPAAPAPRLGGRAAPAARRRAGELGVDIAKVEGTGPEGTITPETSRRRRAATPPVAPSRCAASAGRWRATWRARMRRWCRQPSPTRPTSAAGGRAMT